MPWFCLGWPLSWTLWGSTRSAGRRGTAPQVSVTYPNTTRGPVLRTRCSGPWTMTSSTTSCHVKPDCTSSSNGREVTRAVAPWPHSEAGRFHRGISLLLVGLAAALILVSTARHLEPSTLVLGLPLLLTAWLGRRYSAHFRATPANFPAPTPATGLRMTRTSRTRWGSDARDDLS